MKGIIYYTDSELDENIASIVRNTIFYNSKLPIVSSSLKPLAFGDENIVIKRKRGYVAMIEQIIIALEALDTDYVFFCEHDCLYPKSHFDFVPPRDDIFFYNENVWRWKIGSDTAISHDRMLPLSCMCCNRKLALEFYRIRWEKIQEVGEDHFIDNQSKKARTWGYEPGTKKIKRGGLTDDDFDTWRSIEPVIDMRHKGAFSPSKLTLESFKHKPKWWKEIKVEDVPGWELKKIFNK